MTRSIELRVIVGLLLGLLAAGWLDSRGLDCHAHAGRAVHCHGGR